jgi:uncharacterized protein YhbP (UPF0306 family)
MIETKELMMDVEKTIREYLPNVIHMSLATCADNKPWVCEVHYVYDDELNLYFRSTQARRHSQEIAQNPSVAGNIVERHGMNDKPRGLYFEGTAAMLNNINEDSPEYQLFVERFGAGPEILEDAAQENSHQFYKVTVADWYVFDAREAGPAQKYHLER